MRPSKDRIQKTEGRRQKTEDRSKKPEARRNAYSAEFPSSYF
jgi:hypothetical protein